MILKLKDPQPKHLGEVHYDGHWWALLEEQDGEIRACRPATPADVSGREWSQPETRAALRPLLDACDAIPDFTLSKWACAPGGAWAEVRSALRAARFEQGLNLDAPFDEFDSRGWLLSRHVTQAEADDWNAAEVARMAERAPA